MEGFDIQAIVSQAIEQFTKRDRAEDLKELSDKIDYERSRREILERQVGVLVRENERRRDLAAAAEKRSAIRCELQRLGVRSVDLVCDALDRRIYLSLDDDGGYCGRYSDLEPRMPLKQFLIRILTEHPELAGGRKLRLR